MPSKGERSAICVESSDSWYFWEGNGAGEAVTTGTGMVTVEEAAHRGHFSLAISNTMSLFGLHRALRGAAVGHLAAYEMTSSEPCRRYARGLRRLGASDAACLFFDVHVTADALHEQLAAHDLCEGLSEAEPEVTEDIIFGAAACLAVENRFARHLLDSWDAGRSALRVTDAVLEVVS
jgi:hypothetical protein